MKNFFFSALMALVLIGCADPMTVTQYKGQGKKQTYQADFETVWKAVNLVCKANAYEFNKVEKSSGTCIVRVPARLESWGENIGIFLTDKGQNNTEVEVVSKMAGPHTTFKYNWEEPLLAQIQLALNNPDALKGVAVEDMEKPKTQAQISPKNR